MTIAYSNRESQHFDAEDFHTIEPSPSPPAGKLGPKSASLLLEGTTTGRDAVTVETQHTFPWRHVCRLEIKTQRGETVHGSGWIAGPSLVVTSAHFLYQEDALEGWAESIAVYINGKSVPIQAESFSVPQTWIDGKSSDFGELGGIYLPDDSLPERHGFAGARCASDPARVPTTAHLTGYEPSGEMTLVPIDLVESSQDGEAALSAPLPSGLSGAPVFMIEEGRMYVVGIHPQESSYPGATIWKIRLISAYQLQLIGYWNGTRPEKVTQKILPWIPGCERRVPWPKRLSGDESPHLIYLTGDISNEAPADTKRFWDVTIFGNPLGCSSSHFYYRDMLPATDVPMMAGNNLMGGIRKEARKRHGRCAVDFFDELLNDIAETEDNPLLFGLGNALEWLTLAMAYFFPVTKHPKDHQGRLEIRERLHKELLDFADDGRGVIFITHGFGAVVLFDLLYHKPELSIQIPQVIALANPLAYPTIQKALRAEPENAGNTPLRLPEQTSYWLDLSIATDPIAADIASLDAQDESDRIYHFAEITNVSAPVLKREVTSAYLTLPLLKQFLTALLPRSFGAPVGDFTIARDVSDDMSEPDVRIPTLIELSRPTDDKTNDNLDRRAEEMIKLIVDVATEGPEIDLRDLQLDRMKRYVAADLLPNDLKRLQRRIRTSGKEELMIGRVWKNSLVQGLVQKSTLVVKASAARRTYNADGDGIHWAVLDTGIDRDHHHFHKSDKNLCTIEKAWDFCHPNVEIRNGKLISGGTHSRVVDTHSDASGHGTHVCGIIAGYGEDSIGERYSGMAPKTKIHSFRVLDETGRGRESSIIRALENIYEINATSDRLVIHGVNLSLGCIADPSVYGCGHSPICIELRRLWYQGVVVCVAAGNAGMISLSPTGAGPRRNVNLDISIGDPANLEECIAVGSVHKSKPHNYGISYFSSRGPTADGRVKPDCVAPGERIKSADAGKHNGYREDSGTSMACPHVSGVIAAFLSRKPEFIGQPDRIKQILLDNCIDLKRDRYHQGAGVPDLMAMLASH